MTVWRSKPYRRAFQFFPCVFCGAPSSEAAHYKGDWVGIGLERPPDYCCAPLCTWCHRTGPIAQHKANEAAWWEALGVDPLDFTGRMHGLWEAAIPNIARPQIIELIGITHRGIQEHTNQTYLAAAQQFAADPTPDFAPVVMDAYKRHIISMGSNDKYDYLINTLQRKTDERLGEVTA